jgi:hypothetical protein
LQYKVLCMSKHLDELKEIREMMQKSTRFISLSGLSGVFAGIYALIGAYMAYRYLLHTTVMELFLTNKDECLGCLINSYTITLIGIALVVLILSISTSVLLTYRNAQKNNEKVFSPTAIRMAINVLIPLVVGGIFCMILLRYGLVGLLAPTTLIFYGLALINGSNYTLKDIRYLGYLEIFIGIVAMLDIGHGLLYWSIGFGLLHIVYGAYMYFKYEYKKHA